MQIWEIMDSISPGHQAVDRGPEKIVEHAPLHLADGAELHLQTVKAALPLEELTFLLAQNPAQIAHLFL